jgi:hypothetical protein
MHRRVSVLADPDRWIWLISWTRTGVPRDLNIIVVACAEQGISWDIPPRAAAAGRSTVDGKCARIRAQVGVDFNHKTAIRFVPNFLEALACHSGVMKTYLPRRCVLVICCTAGRDGDKIILPHITPIRVSV